MHFERFSTKLYLLFFLILTSFAISSCDLNGKDPLITMENLAKEAQKDATKWNEKQMKLKIQQASEMLKVLNNNKKDYSKSDYITFAKNYKQFFIAIRFTTTYNELLEEGSIKETMDKIEKNGNELVEYYQTID